MRSTTTAQRAAAVCAVSPALLGGKGAFRFIERGCLPADWGQWKVEQRVAELLAEKDEALATQSAEHASEVARLTAERDEALEAMRRALDSCAIIVNTNSDTVEAIRAGHNAELAEAWDAGLTRGLSAAGAATLKELLDSNPHREQLSKETDRV